MPFAELVLDSGLRGVPRVRRFVVSCLDGSDAAADAELLAAELVTNALLHGAMPVVLRLEASAGNIRIEVEDAGIAVPVRVRADEAAMTGRGLTLVDSIATHWGVAPCHGIGKVVWAVIGDGPSEFLTDLSRPRAEPGGGQVEPYFEVVLGSIPTHLLLEAKAHIDNVVREAVLIGGLDPADGGTPPALAALVTTVTEDFADARTEIKRQALAAADRGEPMTELRLTLPLSAAAAGERYLAALDEADRYARSSHLLTMAAPPSHRAFRAWYVGAIIGQLRAAAEGRVRPAPAPFSRLLANRIDELERLEESERRLRLLQRIASELVTETSVEAIAAIVVRAAADYPSVVTARVYLVEPGRMLRSIAWVGGEPGDDAFAEVSFDNDVPVTRVVLSGAPLSVSSVEQLAEQFPALTGHFPDERSIQVTPLYAPRGVLGALSLTFAGGEVADDAQRAFVQAIADALAQAIERAQATAASERQRGRDLLLLTAQVDVLTDIVNGVDLREALEALLVAVETGSSDGMLASVLLLEPETMRLRHGAAPSLPDFYNRAIDGIGVGPAIGSCGTAAYLQRQVIVTNIAEDPLWADFRDLAAKAGVRACWSSPIFDRRGALLGTFALYYPQPHSPSESDLALIAVLVRAVAMAIERSQADAERDQALAMERSIALTLQQGLLPAVPPMLGPLHLAARYRTGDAGVQVGGDWYDAVQGPDGIFLIVGDVQGHDLRAAALMGQLHTVARVAASDHRRPSDVLGAVNRYLASIDEERIVTAAVIHLDAETATVTVASAGHLPPVLMAPGPDGWTVRDWDLEPGPPLGCGDEWPQAELPADPDSVILLYTDGLVETRTWPIDHGIGLLHRALATLPQELTLQAALDAALEILPSGSRGDDVVVLAGSLSVSAG